MSLTKFGVIFGTVALAVATAASSYTVHISTPVNAAGKKLVGDYKVTVAGEKVTLTQGKEVIDLPATIETNASKYQSTEYTTKDGNLEELHLGGSKTDVKVKADAQGVPAGGGGR